MTAGWGEAREVIIDASGLINLFASGREADLLLAAACRLVIAEVTMTEACFIQGPPDSDGAETRMPIEVGNLQEKGLARVQAWLPEFSRPFVAAARHLTDRDARPVAIAVGLGIALWSDDAKQVRVARSLMPSIEIVSTLSVIRLAIERLALPGADVSLIAHQIRTRGRFLPPRHDPDAGWFAWALAGRDA